MPIGENTNLSIGQIIYVLSNKAQKIIPAVVVEEMIVKKIDGNQISWKVSVGPAGKEKTIDSKRLDGELYSSLEEVQGVLEERLGQFINQIVIDAEKRAQSWYGQKTKQLEEKLSQSDKIDPDSLVDDVIEDDKKDAVATIMSKPAKTEKTITKAQAAKEARKKLMAAMSDEPKPGQSEILDSEEIQLPGGQTVRVNIRT
jgi:hypothetical protein